MTNILSGTVDVTGGEAAFAWHGTPLYAGNCPADSPILIDGQGYFIASLTDTTHGVLTRPYGGDTAGGVVAEISPYTADTVATATANIRLAALLAALAVPQTGRNLQFDGSSHLAGDPGAGKVRFNDASDPTIAWISYTDADGNDISGLVKAIDDIANVASRASVNFNPTDGALAFLAARVTGALTDHTSYAEVPIARLSGTVPANGARLALSWTASGSDGATFNPRGDYAGGTSFAKNDLVQSGGYLFVSAQNGNLGHTPVSSPAPASSAYWTYLPLPGTAAVLAALGVPAIVISTSDPSGAAAENTLWLKVPS